MAEMDHRSSVGAAGSSAHPQPLGIRRHTTKINVRVSTARGESVGRGRVSRTSRVDLAVPVTDPGSAITDPGVVQRDSRERIPPALPFDPNDDYDYESTDEETDENSTCESERTKDVGARTYAALCRQYKTVPVIHVMRQFGNSAISLQDFNLNPRELKAFFLAAVESYINSNLVRLGRENELSELMLGGNSIREAEMVYLCDFISVHYPLVNLTLNRCYMDSSVLQMLAKFIKDNATLRKLDLSENGFTDNESGILADLIQHGHSITDLNLQGNIIGDSAGALGGALARNHTLTKLDLSWNHIRGTGAAAFCNGLKDNYTLKTLDLAWNGFGEEGTTAMAHALAENTMLSMIDLSYNRVNHPAVLELLKGLHENHTLKVLNIGHNPISPAMASVMLTKLLQCTETNLAELDLSGIVVDDQFEEILKELQRCRTFVVRYDKSLPLSRGAIDPIDPDNLFNVDPRRTMLFMEKHLKTIATFLREDRDCEAYPSREEMKKAFEIEGFEISDNEFDEVLKYLKVNIDGGIDIKRLKKMIGEEIRKLAEYLHHSDSDSDMSDTKETGANKNDSDMSDTKETGATKDKRPASKEE